MNTIPSIFNARQINRTVLGGTERPDKVTMPVSCIVLSRCGNQYRSRVFENLAECGFERIISVEPQSSSCNTDQLSRQFPQVKFIIALEQVTPGDMVNIGMAEAETQYVLVLYDDFCIEQLSFTAALAHKLALLDQYCVVPRLVSSTLHNLPVTFIPDSNHSVFAINASLTVAEGMKTLYPFDFTGFFDRNRYMRLGGADYTITSSYWQNIDLSFRAWLWGEKITISTAFQLSYGSEVPGEDSTTDLSYLRFYLKNLLPVFNTDHAQIPNASFFPFRRRSSCGLSESIRQFKDAQRWTNDNKYRFKTDAVSLLEHWGEKE